MAIDIHIYDYRLKDGKKQYGYRFEIASVDKKRKWKNKAGFKTKGEAIKAANEAYNLYNNVGDVSEPKEMSFSDFLDNWIKNDCVDLKPATIANYQKKARLYIKPMLGEYRVKTIKKDNLQDLLEFLHKKGFALNTLNVVKGILAKCFEYAVENHYIPYSPAVKLKIPKNQEPDTATRSKPHVYISKERIQEIFTRFPEGSVNHIPLMLGYKCGLRLGEAFALQWDDIDLNNKTLTVNHQVQWHQDADKTTEDKKATNGKPDSGNGYWYFSPPKYNSIRVIELEDELVALLTREKERQEKAKKYYDDLYYYYYVEYKGTNGIINTEQRGKQINLLNVRESGEYINSRTMQHTSSVIHHQMNFPEFDYHSLRHTHATMLSEQGAPLKFIQNRLGHKKADITVNVYSHLTETLSEQGRNILNKMYE